MPSMTAKGDSRIYSSSQIFTLYKKKKILPLLIKILKYFSIDSKFYTRQNILKYKNLRLKNHKTPIVESVNDQISRRV